MNKIQTEFYPDGVWLDTDSLETATVKLVQYDYDFTSKSYKKCYAVYKRCPHSNLFGNHIDNKTPFYYRISDAKRAAKSYLKQVAA